MCVRACFFVSVCLCVSLSLSAPVCVCVCLCVCVCVSLSLYLNVQWLEFIYSKSSSTFYRATRLRPPSSTFYGRVSIITLLWLLFLWWPYGARFLADTFFSGHRDRIPWAFHLMFGLCPWVALVTLQFNLFLVRMFPTVFSSSKQIKYRGGMQASK